MGINLKVEETRQKIIEVIDEAQLPICLSDYVLTEVLNNVRFQRMQAVQNERGFITEAEPEESAQIISTSKFTDKEVKEVKKHG